MTGSGKIQHLAISTKIVIFTRFSIYNNYLSYKFAKHEHLQLRGALTDQVGLVPRSNGEPKFVSEISQHSPDQPTAVQEERGVVCRS